MLDNLSKYVYEVYRCKSVSAAAKKLFLSQPALSASIKKAEKELGAEIFNRNTIPFTLTAEGKIYIEAIENIIELEHHTLDRIHDISQISSGVLKIATSSNLSHYIIPKLCELFRKKYPKVDINIELISLNSLLPMLTKNTADLAFMPTEKNLKGFKVVPILKENLIVAVRKDFKGTEKLLPYSMSYHDIISRKYPPEKIVHDMSVFNGIEFIYNPRNSNIFKKRKLIFGDTGSEGPVSASTAHQRLNYNLMQSGFGAFLTTDADIATMPPTDECMYFALESPVARQNFSIVYSTSPQSPSYKFICEFVNIAKDFFDCESPLEKII